MTAQSELSALIAKTVEEQTFSLNAIKAIGVIRDKAVNLESRLEESNKEILELKRRAADQAALLAKAADAEGKLVQRESAVAAREIKITDLEKQTAVAHAQAATLSNVFSTIFANRIVRENVVGQTPVASSTPGSYPITMQESKTVERHEG